MTGDAVRLFVYGTLLPDAESWPVLQPFVDGEGHCDWVSGTLYDTGLGYPAATFSVDALTRVLGRTFTLAETSVSEAMTSLDEFEDVSSGLYRRELVITGSGVEAWTYVAGDAFELTTIETGDWLNRD